MTPHALILYLLDNTRDLFAPLYPPEARPGVEGETQNESLNNTNETRPLLWTIGGEALPDRPEWDDWKDERNSKPL